MINSVTTRVGIQEQNTPAGAERENEVTQLSDAIRSLVFLAVPIVIIFFRNRMQPWIFMWLLAASIFAICKLQSWRSAKDLASRTSWQRNVAYLLFWPGMNAAQFLDESIVVPQPAIREWISASAKALSGAALIWLVVRQIPNPLLAAWIAMLGLILVLHFGAFHLLSLIWRSAGMSAQPIMQRPLQSESLSDFWGRRWNLGFRQLSHDWVFAPLRKHSTVAIATLAAFLVSGLIHDLVISVPARAGYGLPTAYFMLQGIGVLAERSALGVKIGLGRGISGWLWMAAFTAAPAYFLFHPWFVFRVMIPFLRAIGAGC